MTNLVLVVAGVILTSAVCSLFEAVLYSVPASHIEAMRAEGRNSGIVLAKLREKVDEPIAAILSLNTIANTSGAAVAGALAAHALGEGSVLGFSVAFTLAILLFSEIIPKTVGVLYSRELAGWIAVPLRLLVLVFTPLVWLIGLVTRLLGTGAGAEVSTEEIISLARLGHRTGAIDADEAAVIQNILALSDTTTKSIMTPRTVVYSLAADTPVEEAREQEGLMIHARIPIHGDDLDDILGIAFRRDVLTAPEGQTVGHVVRPVGFVGEQERADRLLELILEHSTHMLVVLDDFGGFAGIVTLEDVMEEILGKEIVDEFDVVSDMRALARERRDAALARITER